MAPRALLPLLSLACLGAACSATRTPPMEVRAAEAEVFPGVRIDRVGGFVEFDGYVSPLLHVPDEPVFYIEQCVCTPDTRPHESLVVTRARAEHIHAALLLLGLEPGSPGHWEQAGDDVRRVAPTGPPVRVQFLPGGDEQQSVRPEQWIVDLNTGEHHPALSWVFAGSATKRIGEREVYLASDEAEGTIVGFTTFETEIIAPTTVLSHVAAIDEPVWIADVDRVPANESPVVVRLTAIR